MKTNLIKVVAASALITSVLGACSESSNAEVKKRILNQNKNNNQALHLKKKRKKKNQKQVLAQIQ